MAKTNLIRMNSKQSGQGLAALSMILLMLMSVLTAVPWNDLANNAEDTTELGIGVIGERQASQAFAQV